MQAQQEALEVQREQIQLEMEERRAKVRMMSGVLTVETESRNSEVGRKRVDWVHVFGGGRHRETRYAFDHSESVVSANDDHFATKSAAFA